MKPDEMTMNVRSNKRNVPIDEEEDEKTMKNILYWLWRNDKNIQ